MGLESYTLHNAMAEAARDTAYALSVNARMAGIFTRLIGQKYLADEFEAAGAFLKEGAKTYPKPDWRIHDTVVGGTPVSVTPRVVLDKPFMELVRFQKNSDQPQRKLLIVAPMSGHYATLLRDTVKTMLPDNDVYVTDWKNARDVSMRHGRFGFDNYVAYVQDAIRAVGPNTHVMAVCQPTVPTLAAIALMAQNKDPVHARSLTLMAGPIDTRRAPTEVTKLAEDKDMSFFKSLISAVPHGFKGAGRHVYPGHMQLTAFLAMNPDRHIQSSRDLFDHLRRGDGESAAKIREFYDEYNAVMDMPEEFYLETIDRVFQRQLLAKGQLIVAGQKVDLSAITRTPLLTIEGGKDDICGVGQTSAALGLCTGLAASQKRSIVHPDVGHYGTFSGSRFRRDIAKEANSHIAAADVDNGLKSPRILVDTGPMPSNF